MNKKIYRLITSKNYLKLVKIYHSIFGENFKKQFNVSEKFTMKNFIDDFEEKNYEISIKKNISNLTYNKLIAQINRIK